MADGRRHEWRRMILAQAWAVGKLFGESGEAEVEQFLRTGTPGEAASQREPKNRLVDEKVAEYLRTGQLRVE